jgi:hypothetical protein
MRGALIVIACLGAAVPDPAAAQNRLAPTWAVDPARAGHDLPPAGRSLFDFAVTRAGEPGYDVPFPFERLVRHLEARAGCKSPCAKQVLIPLGRSLQRAGAAPAFFEFPRVVAAIDVETPAPGAPLLKDRIYLGYQEKADLVEVISYNEAAGRFEFQIVRDYRAGGAREVVYARRALCVACHQNHAPLFSRQVWDETNANPQVAALLARPGGDTGPARAAYRGVPIRRGVEVPNAIDAATDRANLLAVWQLLWRAGCGDGEAGARCRGAALVAALQYRLTDERAFDERSSAWREDFLPAFGRAWNARWPAGLAIPNPDVPNRDPLPPAGAPRAAGLAAAHVPAAFEPLAPRAPLAVWTAADPGTARRFVAGLAGFVTAAEVHALERQLAARAGGERRAARRHEAPCEIAWTGAAARFKCVGTGEAPLRLAGRIDLRGARVAGGEIGALELDGAPPLEQLAVAAGTFDAGAGRAALAVGTPTARARLADGSAIAGISLAWKPSDASRRGEAREASARATVTTIDDFAPVRSAVAALAAAPGEHAPLAAQTFGRTRVLAPVFARLGVPARDECCEDASRLPPAAAGAPEPPMPAEGPAAPFAAFYPLCASCHATAERSPPNFLAGPPERVAASVKHCAPRIYTRLALWRTAASARDKTPMPPPMPSTRGDGYEPPPAVAGLERTASDLVRAESGAAPRLDALLANGYEALRPCLPG